ncbi:AgrD family cyclic lactone autoinducer peptide [Faecalibacillus faecis]
MKQKLLNKLFAFVGLIGISFASSLSIIGMYEPEKPKRYLK